VGLPITLWPSKKGMRIRGMDPYAGPDEFAAWKIWLTNNVDMYKYLLAYVY
jgi:hypothetical protein